ncbi:OLC1v1012407C1 [Oldenlandia corymbosa var. corymbosa]|uniref:OLC1v1012407C1 n=1 Tax=Oldenlandia corymbosa var. corymbosa TaxID=529605 RepID=A0AAV1DXP8_OLDCO|nr:OLC1v1012407C1 [Oldenlandia corymbosa var. corymbosa]
MASQTVPDFASTINSTEKADSIAEKYNFPIDVEYRAPIGTKRANTPPEGKITVYERSMFLGLRFPLHPLFGRIVQYYKIPLAQFTPNLVTAVLGFVRLCEIKKVALRLLVWKYFFKVMSSSKDTVGLFGDAQIFEIKNSDDEGSSNKVTKKRKLRRLVKASDADPSEAVPPIIEEVEVPMPEDPAPEASPATERHPEWFRPLEASLEKKNVKDTDGSSTYTAAAAIYHFGDHRIECPIIEEVAATLTEEESLKMLTTAMASILMREKTLKQDIVSLQAKRGFLEQERQSSEVSRKGEEALRLAREQELANVQVMYKELEAKLSEYWETHVPRSELPTWITNFWTRMVSMGGLASILVGISNEAKALGGYGVAMAALERMERGRTINVGWLQQFIRPHPKKTLHEALKKGLQQLSDDQLPLFGPLCGAVSEMKSSTEISSFEGDALKVLPDDAGEEVRMPGLAPDFIGVEVEWEEDSSEQAEDDGQSNPEPEGMSAPPPDSYFVHHLHLLILEEDETHSRLVQCFRQQEEEWKRRLHQYDVDFHASLTLEANIYEEMEKLKSEISQLRRREKIVISPWFPEKIDTLALVESQIKIRTKRFIAAIDLLKKRTKEVEFYSKQANILQNILVDNEISLPILDDLDPKDEARERAAAKEYLLRIDDQDWEILDLKDKLGHCVHKLRSMGWSGLIKPSRFNPKGKDLRI